MNKPTGVLTRITDHIADRLGYIRRDTIPKASAGSYLLGSAINPWSETQTPASELRALARRCETLRAVISTIKESVAAVPYRISLKEDTPSGRKALNRAMLILNDPNESKETFTCIIRRLMEDLLILDAGALEVRRAMDGLPRYINWLPGDEIRFTQPEDPGTVPSPAYYRVKLGRIEAEYEINELVYFVRDRQPSGYGG